MATLEDALAATSPLAEEQLTADILSSSTSELTNRTKLLENEIKIMRSDMLRLNHEHAAQHARIAENTEKVKLSKQLPYLVANVVEILDGVVGDEGDDEEDGGAVDADIARKGQCAVIKTSTRQVIP